MTNKLGDSIKSLVIQQWLQGLSRDTIAANNGISAGAVTNTVNEWRQALGSTTGTELRELGVTLKKVGINPAQCATGFRAAIAMAKLGVKEEAFESFISDVYDRCRDQGITPENTASYLKDLLEFSKTVPFSKMSGYILQKTDEKEKLEAEINELNDQKWKLIGDISNLETRHHVALDDQKITEDDLKWYTDLKAELGKNGVHVDDISHLLKVVNGIKQHGFSAEQVLQEFSNLELLRVQCEGYQGSIISLKSRYDSLDRDCSFLQQTVSSYNKSLSIYSELEAMGFGLKELKSLWYTVREIAGANSISLDEAVEKFLKDVDEQYDDKLGLESDVKNLRVEVSKLKQQETNSRAALFLHPLVGSTILGLFQSGVNEQDILTISELFKADSHFGISKEEGQSLTCEVWKYIDIKSIVKELTQQAGKLRKEVSLLLNQKEILNAEIKEYAHDKNSYINNKDNGLNFYSNQELELIEHAAESNAWDCFKGWAMQASSDENTSYIDPQSKEERKVRT